MGLEDTNIEISTFLTYIIAYFEGLYTPIILHLLCVFSTISMGTKMTSSLLLLFDRD